ncbi:glycosyltransferase [Larkinella bovis]|uniref:Glycosyltransferase n=1 Tax=Larkinella bovis TaxID=683041 RepID=A0ABW0I762_9BACT
MKVLIVGDVNNYSLESSYRRAFQQLKDAVQEFSIYREVERYTRFGRLGLSLNRFWPVDAWLRKANRALAVAIKSGMPDLVLVFGNAPVLFSTLAFAKSISNVRFVLVWPDPLTGMQAHVREAAALYDGVATYCRASKPVFEQLGFCQVHWVPLAADPVLHKTEPRKNAFGYDLTFVGAWRPEREQALSVIIRQFPHLKMGIRGTDWQRVNDPVLRPFLLRQPLRGRAYSDMLNQSRINLNVIDDTCFPAANMRFFEIAIAGGLQLASACPEWEAIYKDGEQVLYYHTDAELVTQVRRGLQNPLEAESIRQTGFRYTLKEHTYQQRAEQLKHLFYPSEPVRAFTDKD